MAEFILSPLFATIYQSICVFIFGIAIGSFLNVLSDRLPNEESIFGRSHCDYCKRTLTFIDLFPILSFIFLKGRCRTCKKKLSFQYPLVEFLTGAAFVLTWLFIPVTQYHLPIEGQSVFGIYLGNFSYWHEVLKIFYLVIIAILIVILIADFKYQIIPDSMQVSLFVFSFFILFIQSSVELFLPTMLQHLLAGLAIMAPLLLLFIFTKGRGMGFGDVKLAFVIGFLFGIIDGYVVLYIAFVTGALYGLVLILTKQKKMRSKIPFGPFLVLGILVMLFFGNVVHNLLMQLYGI